MNVLHNIKLARKLPAIMIFLTALAITVTGVASYRNASSAMLGKAEDMLSTVAEAKHIELQSLLDGVDSDIRGLSENPTVLSAARGFGEAWRAIEGDKGAYLRKVYVQNNPNPEGDKKSLDFAPDGSAYSQVHKLYHPFFRNLAEEKGYNDLYVFNLNGDLIYSVNKRADYAADFLEGAFRESGLGRVVAQALAAKEFEVAFEDFDTYAASSNARASFVGSPILDRRGDVKGVIAFEMPSALIGGILARTGGLGDTGQAFLVDKSLAPIVNAAPEGEATALLTQAAVGAAEAAASGKIGLLREVKTDEASGSTTAVLSSFRPVDFHEARWGLIVEQSVDEILIPARRLGLTSLWEGLVGAAIVAAMAILMARSVSKPLGGVEAAMRAVSDGDYAIEISGTQRGDEIGGIARALNDFKNALARAEGTTRDGIFKGAAFEGSSASLMMIDNDFKITYMNGAAGALMASHEQTFAEMFGTFDAKEIVGSSIDIFHKHPDFVRKRLSNPDEFPISTDIRVGETYFSLDVNAVKDAGGNQIGCVLEWNDVTEVRTSAAVLSSIFADQSFAEFNVDGTMRRANPNFSGLAGLDADDITGRKYTEIFQFDANLASERGNVWDRLLTGESIFGRFNVKAPDGRLSLLEGTFSSVKDKGGSPFRIVFLGADITASDAALREAEAEQKRMKEHQDQVVEGLRIGLKNLADGDLTSRIETEFSAEYETLRSNFNAAMDNLLEAMCSVVENADMIRGEASEISNAADDLSRRTEKQAATLEETASALDELTSSVRSAADGANHASEMVASAKSNAEASGDVVQEAVEAMSEIENSSNQISKITSVIDDIAFQTNLLALNAGVEAARAGDAGRGFAVVASEVRALAQRSSDAAREINELISKSGAHVKRGVGLVGETGEALRGIVASVSEIANNVSEIAVSSREQSSGLAEINSAVNQLDQVTQQNAAMFEQTTAASHSLTKEAENLTKTTARFSISGGAAPSDATVTAFEPVPELKKTPPMVTNPAASNEKRVVNGADAVAVGGDDWEDF